jgi:hypothetical protein
MIKSWLAISYILILRVACEYIVEKGPDLIAATDSTTPYTRDRTKQMTWQGLSKANAGIDIHRAWGLRVGLKSCAIRKLVTESVTNLKSV